jgi:EamA domain-containing membrane protein RarD
METTRGILFRLSAVMFFVAMFAMIKATSDIVPAGQAVFYRSAFALPVIIGWMVIRSEIGIGLKVKSRSGHFWRSIFGTVALSLNFAVRVSARHMPKAERDRCSARCAE